MEPILINKDISSVKTEIDYLITRELKSSSKGLRKWMLYLSICSIIIVGLLLIINSEKIAVPIAISMYIVGFFWIITLPFGIKYLLLKSKRKRWRNRIIKHSQDNQSNHYLKFDEEQISVSNELSESIVKWDYFKYYSEYNQVLFILKEKSLYDTLSFSPLNIGTENLEKLKLIVHTKLIPLPPI